MSYHFDPNAASGGFGGASGGAQGPIWAALGIVTTSVDHQVKRRRTKRRDLGRDRKVAALLMPDERVAHCGWSMRKGASGVGVMLRDGDDPQAYFTGLQVCGSVWMCPSCSYRIAETRRRELNDLLHWARVEGFQPVMLTLTTRHGIRDNLSAQLDAMKRAKQRLRQRREWRAIKDRIAGTVTATEVTHGSNGWHTHFHEILLMRAPTEAEALGLLSDLDRVWRVCLVGVGLSGGRAAWDVRGAASAGNYVAKWGAAEELALGNEKSARTGGGRSPGRLLKDAGAGDKRAARLWQDYARTFKGRRQLVWSPGLKAAAGIGEVSDEAAAAEDSAEMASAEEPILLVTIPAALWVGGARRFAADILDAAEITGSAGAVWAVLESIFGPSMGGFRPPHATSPPAEEAT